MRLLSIITIFITLFFIANDLQAYMVPYLGKRTYFDRDDKKLSDSRYVGFTTYVKKKRALVDGDFRYTVNDNFSNTEKSSRYDLTGVYSSYGSGSSWRVGGHYIKDRDTVVDNGLTLLAGVKTYKVRDYELGATLFHSTYPEFLPKHLSVWQLTPFYQVFTAGHGKKNSFSLLLSCNLTTAPDWASGPDSHDHFYFSGELSIAYYRKYFNIGGDFWIGKRIYHVSYDGMDISNHLLLERLGYSGFARYRIFPDIWLKFEGKRLYMTNLNGSGKTGSWDYIFSVQIHR